MLVLLGGNTLAELNKGELTKLTVQHPRMAVSEQFGEGMRGPTATKKAGEQARMTEKGRRRVDAQGEAREAGAYSDVGAARTDFEQAGDAAGVRVEVVVELNGRLLVGHRFVARAGSKFG